MKQRRTIASFRRDTARRLRADATGAEVRLWQYLRRSPILGSHFRRQVPIGPYVADFACLAARLVIEVDGSQHGLSVEASKDAERTRWLEREGYRVIRFWNNEVMKNISSVLEAIHVALDGSRDSDVLKFKHVRQPRVSNHPTPARHSASKTRVNALMARRPSPSRGG
jgi:very-short-patch-repair endonuclease